MKKASPYRLFAQYSGIILLLPTCLLVGYWIGDYLDGRLGTSPLLTLLFLLLGAAAGFVQVFRMLKP